MRRPRRNSDGTMSFPSQNPYTDRRPDEPKMPKGMEWSMLSKDERERLRGLSKEHAENIGLHILAAFALEESDPELALEHAKWVARQASRIDFARETLAFVAYRQGDYKLALREFRTAYRMNGFLDYLPFMLTASVASESRRRPWNWRCPMRASSCMALPRSRCSWCTPVPLAIWRCGQGH